MTTKHLKPATRLPRRAQGDDSDPGVLFLLDALIAGVRYVGVLKRI